MKKGLLLGCAVALASASNAQIFSEDFQGLNGTFPAGWSLFNVDNLTPDAAVAYVTDAWIVREDFKFDAADTTAFSTSWYDPAPGVANDWMFTPAITLPASGDIQLAWEAVTYDATFTDGYEVRIMTTAPNSGNLMSSTVLATIPAENAAWTNRTVSLNAYVGQTVYIAFRNNSTDKFLLLIDDVTVSELVMDDAVLTSIDVPTNEYTACPTSQAPVVPIMATVTNNGTNALSNVVVNLNVYDGSFTLIHTHSSAPLATLAAGANAQITATDYQIPAVQGTYFFEYEVTHSAADGNSSDNFMFGGVIDITTDLYARDNGSIAGSIGIGAGAGYLGQAFEILNTADVVSVSFGVNGSNIGDRAACVIWDMSAGEPNAIIASTDTLVYTSDTAGYYTLPINGGALTLNPGMYVVTAVEFDSILQLFTTDEIFTTGTTWVDFPGSPAGGWANSEDFGFSNSFMLRLNFGAPVVNCTGFAVTATSTNATCAMCNDGSATAMVSGGTSPYTYLWTNGDTTMMADSLMAGSYMVVAMDINGCMDSINVMVGADTCGLMVMDSVMDASCAMCNDGMAMVTVSGGAGPYNYMWSNGDTTMMADSLMAGAYTVTIVDANGCVTTSNLVVSFLVGTNSFAADNTVMLYPNPNDGQFAVNIPAAFGGDVQMTVVNMMGAAVYTSNGNQVGVQQVRLPELAAGTYFVHFSNAQNKATHKVVILNR